MKEDRNRNKRQDCRNRFLSAGKTNYQLMKLITSLDALTGAPVKIQKWLERMKGLMKEMLEVENYYFAIDPVTRKFTEDNITMSVKAATGLDCRRLI